MRRPVQLGVNPFVLMPGEPMSMYHWEGDQEAFLVVSGEAVLIVEGDERPLRAWDFFHSPPGTKHVIIGAGNGPCAVIAVGSRQHDELGFPADEVARRYGASVEDDTTDGGVAYANVPPRQPTHVPRGLAPMSQTVLAVDVGGSHVKLLLSEGAPERRRFESGPDLKPQETVEQSLALAGDWSYDVVSVGVPAPVRDGQIVLEPVNLGTGWVGFDFAKAFGKPTKVVNDAAMQALGSYDGGKMLFLGLGTGLGSALVLPGAVQPMELAHLPFRKATFEDYVGERGRERLGKKKWRAATLEASNASLRRCRRTTSSSAAATRSTWTSFRPTSGSERTRTRSSVRSGSGIRTHPRSTSNSALRRARSRAPSTRGCRGRSARPPSRRAFGSARRTRRPDPRTAGRCPSTPGLDP